VTRDVGQIRDVTIYGRPMSDNSVIADMENLTFYSLSTLLSLQLDKGTHSLSFYLLGDPLTSLLM